MAIRVAERYVPRIDAEVPCTALVVTVKVTPVAPAGMVIDEGTWAADGLVLVRETTAPLGGAAPLRVSVPVDEFPPVTVLGFKASAVKAATDTVSGVVLVVPYTAVIVTAVEDATPLVVMVNAAVVEPAGIVTLAGTRAAAVLLLCRVTTAPVAGAFPFRVTVPVELLPPTTDVGVLVSDDSVGALTVRVVVRMTPYVPEIVTEVFTAIGLVEIVKVALLEPATIVTVAGTCAADVLLLLSVTTAPVGGAAPLRVTVPVELLPPTTEVGDLLTEDNDDAVTVRVALALVPRVAVMTEVVVEDTPRVVTVKVADVLPASTVTLAGTLPAVVLLLLSDTEVPPVGAATLSLTVPVELLPPTTLVGLSVTEDRVTAGFTVRVAVRVVPTG